MTSAAQSFEDEARSIIASATKAAFATVAPPSALAAPTLTAPLLASASETVAQQLAAALSGAGASGGVGGGGCGIQGCVSGSDVDRIAAMDAHAAELAMEVGRGK